MRQRFVTATLCFLALGILLPGCATQESGSKPSVPDPNLSAPTVVLGASVDPQAPFPLWLPKPGPASTVDLRPRAEEARQRGLKAASSGDWSGAVAAFKEANTSAHCSPALIFNLALAYQRGGWSVPAAMWYRAYLAALPEASNAAEVRAEIQKLVAETETRSLRLLDEAERLAEALSATPPSAGAKSLRQIALEDMAAYAYMAGMKDRGDALVRKALALPGANNATEKMEYPDKYGLYAAAYSWDAKRVEDIVARFGNEYTPEIIFNYRTYAWGMRGNWGEVRKIVDAYPSGLLPDQEGLGINKKHWINETWAYEMLENMHARTLDRAKKFDQKWYMGTLMTDLQNVFWNGRPDIAQRLARRALEYYGKFNPEVAWDSYWGYIIPNALLGNRKAIVQEMGRWKAGRGGVSVDIAALFAVASMAREDAEAMIMEIVRWEHQPHYEGTYVSLESTWSLLNPEAYFALAIAKGDSMGALKYLEVGDQSSKEYQDRVYRALRFAVATGRSQLAFDLSEKSNSSLSALGVLNRLAANPGTSESDRERVNRYAASMSGGWRPIDPNHARKVSLHFEHARWLAGEKQYGTLPADAEKTAKEKPEKLPAELAGHAIVLWMGAMAARLEDSSGSAIDSIASRSKVYTYQGRQITLAPEMVFDLTGMIKRADVALSSQDSSDYFLSINLTDNGAQALKEFTGRNIGREVGMTHKGKLVSIAILRESISGGRLQISGSTGTMEELMKLASELSRK